MIKKYKVGLVGLVALVSNLAFATPLSPGETGAFNAFRRYWTDNQFSRQATWRGNEDSTNTLQSITYTSFINSNDAAQTSTPLTDVDFIMALADRSAITALQRRAILDNDGAYLEGNTGQQYADSLQAESYYNNGLIRPHIPSQNGIPDPYENPIRETTWGNIKYSMGRR